MDTHPHDELIDIKGLEILSPDECWDLLDKSSVGRIGFVDSGQPLILPVNHAVVGRHIVFRTARGAKLGSALMKRPVCFEVDDWDATNRTGWSVLVEGMSDIVDDEDELLALENVDLQPWADRVEKSNWIRILPEGLSGRRLPTG